MTYYFKIALLYKVLMFCDFLYFDDFVQLSPFCTYVFAPNFEVLKFIFEH
jgi:hypothetical protein